MEELSSNLCFEGQQNVYRHFSESCACDMVFAVYFPPQAALRPVPIMWFLSGLTCTHENAMVKAGLQAYAARFGMALVFPDTSPRGEDVPDDDAYDMGQGAGFYVNATQAPWKKNFQIYDYVIKELPALLKEGFSDRLDFERQVISGHSMGGHGALTIGIKNPEIFTSISAFAPMANPTQSDWGRKQFAAYLGDDEASWAQYDASLLLRERGFAGAILVDQGIDDQFIDLLRPEALAQALGETRQPSVFRMRKGYDHSYFFVSTFVGEHVRWHARQLGVFMEGRRRKS